MQIGCRDKFNKLRPIPLHLDAAGWAGRRFTVFQRVLSPKGDFLGRSHAAIGACRRTKHPQRQPAVTREARPCPDHCSWGRDPPPQPRRMGIVPAQKRPRTLAEYRDRSVSLRIATGAWAVVSAQRQRSSLAPGLRPSRLRRGASSDRHRGCRDLCSGNLQWGRIVRSSRVRTSPPVPVPVLRRRSQREWLQQRA